MAVDKALVSGSMTMLILRLLSEKDMYGYEMIDALEKRSNHIFEFKAGSLYPLLHSLMKNGYLNGYDRKVNGKLRRYYQVTANGQKYLRRMGKERKPDTIALDMMIGGV